MAYSARTAALPRGYGFSPYLLDSVTSASVVAGSVCKGASVTFLTAAQLPQGYYQINILAGFGSTGILNSADNGNMTLNIGATTITALPVPAAVGIVPLFYYLTLSGTDTLTIVAGYGATASAQYIASVIATAMHPGA